jgi:hypothetical protein
MRHLTSHAKCSGRKPSWRRIARKVPVGNSPLPVGTVANMIIVIMVNRNVALPAALPQRVDARCRGSVVSC